MPSTKRSLVNTGGDQSDGKRQRRTLLDKARNYGMRRDQTNHLVDDMQVESNKLTERNSSDIDEDPTTLLEDLQRRLAAFDQVNKKYDMLIAGLRARDEDGRTHRSAVPVVVENYSNAIRARTKAAQASLNRDGELIKTLQSENAQLTDQLATKTAECVEFKQQTKELERWKKLASDQATQIKVLKATDTSTKAANENLDNEIRGLRKTNSELRESYSGILGQKHDAHVVNASLAEDGRAPERSLKDARTQLKKSNAQLQETRPQLEEAKRQLEENKTQLAKVEIQLEEAKAQAARRKTQRDRSIQESTAKGDENKKLLGHILELKSRVAADKTLHVDLESMLQGRDEADFQRRGCLISKLSLLRGKPPIYVASLMGSPQWSCLADLDDTTPCSPIDLLKDINYKIILTWLRISTRDPERLVSILWDIWAVLEGTLVYSSDINTVACALITTMKRIFELFSRGLISELGFWIAAQIVCSLQFWKIREMDLADILPQNRFDRHTDWPLVLAGLSRILALDTNEPNDRDGGLFESLEAAAEKFPETCRCFSVEIDDEPARVVLCHLPALAEVLVMIQFSDRRCVLWHDGEEKCSVMEHASWAVWLRLDRGRNGTCWYMVVDDEMEPWLIERFERKKPPDQDLDRLSR
ncbi:MAG: hypothetical protein L6R41_001056 [Letrouitia leprolyta]|nr:MAG: hypothetical protein L6R41_001056 [Letrouitia leprolyta]